ncbi:cytochrome c peroxidase [Methylomarinum sp. Ch1-1]|uniref:Cytochrome c peroxidase n=1 Tax=Methylomarinum roseum TaxID=3067653 RepID=A0AAU7P006_9GAMM
MAGPRAALSAEEKLGQALFNEENLSLNHNQSCASCHRLKPLKSGKWVIIQRSFTKRQ